MKTKEILYKHAKKRAAERYDLEINFSEYERLNQLILNRMRQSVRINDDKIYFLAKESNRLYHFLIDSTYIVVFCKQRNAITTYLPPDAIHNYLTGSKYFENRKKWK